MSMPWCIRGNIIDSRVLSWPPCSVSVDVNTAAGLPTKAPDSQRSPVLSRKYFSGAAILPNRVGLPRARPSQAASSSRLA